VHSDGDGRIVRGLDTSAWPDDERTTLPCPWPALEPYLHLRPGHLLGIAAPADSREALAGYDLARHTAAHGIRTLLYAPRFARRNPVDLLHWQQRPGLSPSSLEKEVAAYAHHHKPYKLAVIDSFDHLTLQPDARAQEFAEESADAEPHTEGPAGELGRQLKRLARPHGLTIVVMIHLTAPAAAFAEQPLTLETMGPAADLDYDADTLLLLRRTSPTTVDLVVAKDRHGPYPHRATLEW
jgi:hypothetical protein